MLIVIIKVYLILCFGSLVNIAVEMFLGYNVNLQVFHYNFEQFDVVNPTFPNRYIGLMV